MGYHRGGEGIQESQLRVDTPFWHWHGAWGLNGELLLLRHSF